MTNKGLFLPVLFFLAMSASAVAQAWPPAQGTATVAGLGVSPYDKNNPKSLFLTGRVVVEEGMPLPQPAAVQSSCNGTLHTEGYTDSRGYFTFEMTGARNSLGSQGSETPSLSGNLPACELQADLPGFISEKVDLAGASDSAGVIRTSTIVVHPATRAPGAMISATSAAAPGNAQKNFRKGCEQAQKGQWEAARESFEKAVHTYPKYAQAWLYLGQVRMQQGQFDAARQSFQESLAADPKSVEPYTALADLALREKHWQELADTTDHILQLDPVGRPQYWYLNSAANYELKKVDKAEKSALQGLRVDVRQAIPKMQYLLAAILTLKHDYRGAADHIRSYLRLAPHAPDAAVAQQQLQQLEKLSGAAE